MVVKVLGKNIISKCKSIDLFFLEMKIIMRNQEEDIKAFTQISQRSVTCSVSWILMFT